MRVQCLMPVDHDARCPWPHAVTGGSDHVILVDRIQVDPDRDRARCRLRCVVGGCFRATVSISPARSMTRLVDLLTVGPHDVST